MSSMVVGPIHLYGICWHNFQNAFATFLDVEGQQASVEHDGI